VVPIGRDMKRIGIEGKSVNLRLVSNRGKARGVTEGNEYFFDEPDFKEILNLERKRSQRSKKPLLLMCLDISSLMKPNFDTEHHRLLKAFATGVRETDVRGWYKRGSIVGILFTEIESAAPSVREILYRRVMSRLVSQIDPGALFKIKVTFLMYPEGKVHDEAVDHYDMRYHKHLANKTPKFNLSAKIKSLLAEASNFLMY
jgi:hypothetical protein